MRINTPQKNLKKAKEALLYILSKISDKQNIDENVIYNLLYFIDFDFYEKFEEQLLGLTYIKKKLPTPIEFKSIIDDMIKNNDIIEVKEKH